MSEIIVASWSEVSTARQCPNKHLLAYKERWTKDNDDLSPLTKGTMWHLVMEDHYRHRMLVQQKEPTPHSTARKTVEARLASFRDEGRHPDNIDLMEWMYQGYVDTYGEDRQWRILGVEHRFQLPLPEEDGSDSGFFLKGSIDLVARNLQGELILVDHKTCSMLPEDADMQLDDQLGLYDWAMWRLAKGKAKVCIYSYAKTKMNKGDHPGAIEEWEERKAAGEKPGVRPKAQPLETRFAREYAARSEQELVNVALDALATLKMAYGTTGRHARNFDKSSCKWMCSYKDACTIGRKYGRERELKFLKDVGFRQDFTRH